MTGLRGREIWLVVDETSRVMRYEEMNESHVALFGAGGNAGDYLWHLVLDAVSGRRV